MSTSPPSINPRRIQQLMSADSRACTALLALLKQEQAALKGRDQSRLETLLADKQTYTTALEEGARQRQLLLQEAGLDTTAAAWRTLLESLDRRYPGIGLSSAWSALAALFEDCQKHNNINGKMIARGQQTMSRLLNLLRGQTAAPGLYDRAGSTSGKGPGTHNVVKA
ncbi:flagellar protein FlgN [Exilibacterium tricleocarpae]|uniref:Flagellar protein FlgN n=1 Tax=Exilibacterium tricleocarpae TaxID=2591008 RepID=A0A545U3S2_9GAMM|nr:flagellar protein FlgN [Exilibacterium tricleocarpae]TQV84125.1 flagellar protein FlgN [Exilibacterium tricleocarpae]